MLNTVAHREEELSVLQKQLEDTQLKLSSTQASNGHPLGLTKSDFTPMGLSGVFMEAGGLKGPWGLWHDCEGILSAQLLMPAYPVSPTEQMRESKARSLFPMRRDASLA